MGEQARATDDQQNIVHGTVVVERRIDASPDKVFATFVDPKARERWGAPSPSAVYLMEKFDLRDGGEIVARCGSRENPEFRVEGQFLSVVSDQTLLYVECVSKAGHKLSAALVTTSFTRDRTGTLVKVTAQVTSFGGSDMVDATRTGFTATLGNLEQEASRAGGGSA